MPEEKKGPSRVTLLNIISNILLQITLLISGFVTSKIILNYFGSETNGLVSSINQFLNYITLIEGGLTGVLGAQLYKPLIEKDIKKISSIIKTANNFYKKIGFIFIGYTLVVGMVYPFIIHSDFSFKFIFVLTIVLSINLLSQYMYAITYRILLDTDKRIYITAFTQILMNILGLVFGMISIFVYPHIIIFKFLTGIVFALQPIIYTFYVKKHYNLDKNAIVDKNLLKKRWDGFAVNIAAFIHYCTDTVILSIFTDLNTVSVYSVYALVTSGIRHIISAISSAISPNIGRSYAKGNQKELNTYLDLFEYAMLFLSFFFYSIGGLLITPFVLMYTRNVTDTNYNQPVFGILIIIAEFLYVVKSPHLNLSYSAGIFKELKVPSFIEAFLNIIVSLILVNIFGLIGVAIGTLVGMAFRCIFQVLYTKKLVPDRNPLWFFNKMFLFLVFSAIGIAISVIFISPVTNNITNWVIHGTIYSLIFLFLYIILSILFFKKEVKFIIDYMKVD